jgi:hypothetical protein
MITQESKNSCGKAIIQQYMLYTQHNHTYRHTRDKEFKFPSRWTTPRMIRKAFTNITKKEWERHTHLSVKQIQKYVTIYNTPLPILWLVVSATNPHKESDKKSYIHWLHYYLLIWFDTKGFTVYNPFGYEETITYTKRAYLFEFKSHPTIRRKRYERLLLHLRIIQPSMVLIVK